MKTKAVSLFGMRKNFGYFKKIVKIGVFVSSFMILTACMMVPYYKTMPYLPAVKGIVIDNQNNAIKDVKIYWKGESPQDQYQTFSNDNGNFEFKVIDKYITWKLVAMDPGWGGLLVFEKEGYKSVTKQIVGFYDPKKEFEIEILMELSEE